MTIQQCRYILEIARCRSISKAAKSVFVAQASLSASVKELECELNIQIFDRSKSGVQITKDGLEFIEYAQRIISQVDIVKERYSNKTYTTKFFSISTQHYDFVAEAFAKFMNNNSEGNYNLSIKETKTYETIQDVKYSLSDLGILAVNQSTKSKFMEKIFRSNGLIFHPLFDTQPYIFVGEHHTLAKKSLVKQDDVLKFPYIAYEQGEKSAIQISEELTDLFMHNKCVKINDRATLMNLLLETDGYTIGTGVMLSKLNDGKIVSVPMESKDIYTVGWISRANIELSSTGKEFINLLSGLIDQIRKDKTL